MDRQTAEGGENERKPKNRWSELRAGAEKKEKEKKFNTREKGETSYSGNERRGAPDRSGGTSA